MASTSLSSFPLSSFVSSSPPNSSSPSDAEYVDKHAPDVNGEEEEGKEEEEEEVHEGEEELEEEEPPNIPTRRTRTRMAKLTRNGHPIAYDDDARSSAEEDGSPSSSLKRKRTLSTAEDDPLDVPPAYSPSTSSTTLNAHDAVAKKSLIVKLRINGEKLQKVLKTSKKATGAASSTRHIHSNKTYPDNKVHHSQTREALDSLPTLISPSSERTASLSKAHDAARGTTPLEQDGATRRLSEGHIRAAMPNIFAILESSLQETRERLEKVEAEAKELAQAGLEKDERISAMQAELDRLRGNSLAGTSTYDPHFNHKAELEEIHERFEDLEADRLRVRGPA